MELFLAIAVFGFLTPGFIMMRVSSVYPRIVLAAAILALAVGLTDTAWAQASGSKPNIIFVFTDDMGYGDLGVLHQNQRTGKKHATPNIDRFAAEGIQLRRHYCPAPVCAPSRASLLRGLHQGHTEVRNSDFDKELPDNHTLGTVMQGAGYRTLHVGKYGLQGIGETKKSFNTPDEWPAYPTKRGFDEYLGYIRHVDGHVHYPNNDWPMGNSPTHQTGKEVWHNEEEISAGLDKCYTTDLFTAYAKKWIVDHTQSKADQPFFIYLAYDTPHAALQVPTQAFPEGGGLEGGLQWLDKPGHMINTASGEIDSWIHPEYRNPDWSNVEQRFATMVRRIDSAVGDLIQLLKDLQIDEETMVVFTNDNGPLAVSYIAGTPFTPVHFQSYGPFDGEKRDVWEGGIRMPALARWPGGIPAGQVDHTPSQFHDWMTTFADLGGVPLPALSDGVSLLPALTGEGTQKESTVYVEFLHGGRTPNYPDFDSSHQNRPRKEMQALFLEGFKGVRVDIKGHSDDFEIYDVKTDLKEVNNLAGTSAFFDGLQQRLKDRSLQLRRPNSDNPRPYDGELVPAVSVASTRPGARWLGYKGEFPWVPKFWDESPQQMGGVTQLRGNLGPESGAVVFTGYLNVPSDGEYVFSLTADSGAIMRIHDANIIDADFGYEGGTEITASVKLEAGLHPFSLNYLKDADNASSLDVQWSGPSLSKRIIAIDYLSN
jgi:uncharacterized sulfatase